MGVFWEWRQYCEKSLKLWEEAGRNNWGLQGFIYCICLIILMLPTSASKSGKIQDFQFWKSCQLQEPVYSWQ